MPPSPHPSVPEAFLCPISQEIMADPVVAADGHSYERVAIETWFRSKQTSPMTNDAMPSTILTPNRLLKSQISEWQGQSSAQWIGDLISAVAMRHGDPAVVEGKLLELARFVGHHRAVVLPGTLKMLSAMLQASEQLWIAPVRHALQVAEAECKLIVAGLAAKLRDERRDEKLATAAAAAARGKLAKLDIEVAAAEEALDKLREQRSKQAQDMEELQRVEEQCRSSAAQVEHDLSGYPDPLALLEEGRDSEDEPGEAPPEGQTRSKRKRATEEEQSGTVVTKRPRGDGGTEGSRELDCEVLVREGLEWWRGNHFRVVDQVRGRLLIEAAAAGGLPLAVAMCQSNDEGWGGYGGDDDDKQAAFDAFRELASERKAATWIVLEAQISLGACYRHGIGVEQDDAEAVKWFRKAAEQGNSRAQNSLGNCYWRGIGIEKHKVQAVKWYCKAAEQGNSTAQYSLGNCYRTGLGIEKDAEEAMKWYRKAAEKGHSTAQNSLGYCYWYGIGMEQDKVEAVKWYHKAAEQGNNRAQNSLGSCYRNGIGAAKNYVEAVKWYRKAAEQGNSAAQNNLGNCYRTGLGMEKDGVEAVKWYYKAAEQGHLEAQYSFGNCYRNGIGVEQDDAEAVEWYRKAADQGYTVAIREMARCYQEGTGVDQDDAEASRWQQQLESSSSDSDDDDG
eukprot:SAG25_NODE_857_length_5044_cov_2.869970_3_plen_674_part_00